MFRSLESDIADAIVGLHLIQIKEQINLWLKNKILLFTKDVFFTMFTICTLLHEPFHYK